MGDLTLHINDSDGDRYSMKANGTGDIIWTLSTMKIIQVKYQLLYMNIPSNPDCPDIDGGEWDRSFRHAGATLSVKNGFHRNQIMTSLTAQPTGNGMKIQMVNFAGDLAKMLWKRFSTSCHNNKILLISPIASNNKMNSMATITPIRGGYQPDGSIKAKVFTGSRTGNGKDMDGRAKEEMPHGVQVSQGQGWVWPTTW